MTKYEDLRDQAIKFYKKKNINNFYLNLYENSKISIPDKFLNLYLFDNENLRSISNDFKFLKKNL